jgi:hypothetical protein
MRISYGWVQGSGYNACTGKYCIICPGGKKKNKNIFWHKRFPIILLTQSVRIRTIFYVTLKARNSINFRDNQYLFFSFDLFSDQIKHLCKNVGFFSLNRSKNSVLKLNQNRSHIMWVHFPCEQMMRLQFWL